MSAINVSPPAAAPAERVAIVSPAPANDIGGERDDDGLRRFYIENPTVRGDAHVRFGVPEGAALKMVRCLIRDGLIPSLRNAVSYTERQRVRAIEMIKAGASNKEIVEATDMTRSQVAAIAKDEGVPSGRARVAARRAVARGVKHAARRAAPAESEDEDALLDDETATPRRCESFGCPNPARRRGTCEMHRPFDRRAKRKPVLTPQQQRAEIAAFIEAGKVTQCPPPTWTPKQPLAVENPEPRKVLREPRMTRDERRDLDWETRQILNRAASAHRGQLADTDPALVVGLHEAAIVVGVDIKEIRTLSDNGAVPFRWRSGRRVFTRWALEGLRDRLEAEGDDGDNEPSNEIAPESANTEQSAQITTTQFDKL